MWKSYKKKKKGSLAKVLNQNKRKSQEWGRVRKSLHMALRVLSVIFMAIAILGGAIIFVLTLVQIRWPNAGAAFPSDAMEHYAYNNLDTDCNSDDLRHHHPLRYEVLHEPSQQQQQQYEAEFAFIKRQSSTTGEGSTTSDDSSTTASSSTTGGSISTSTSTSSSTSISSTSTSTTGVVPPAPMSARFEYCGWDSKNSWFRSVNCWITMIWGAFLMWRLRKRSPASNSASIWKKPKRVLKMLMIVSVVVIALWLIAMITDGIAVVTSSDWCKKQEEETKMIRCDYVPFVLTVLLDMTMVILWVIMLGIMILRYKYFNKYMQLEEEDEEDEEEMT